MAAKIAIKELNRRIASGEVGEQEIRRYFQTNEALSPKPFRPGIEPDPDTVDLSDPVEMKAFHESFGAGDILIRQQRLQRDVGFKWILKNGYKAPIIVSRGDSWFLHPLLYDIVDWLRGRYAIKSFDYPGDTLDDILKDQNEWQAAIRDLHADIFMLSGGGNDALGGGEIATNLNHYDSAITDPDNYLKASYHQLVDECLAKIEKLFENVLALSPNVTIICHGYDRVVPNGGPWLGDPMKGIGIIDPSLQKKITDTMVESFNAKLAKLAKQYAPRVYYLRLLGVVTAGWHDELHPTDTGFQQIGSQFRGAIDRVSPIVS